MVDARLWLGLLAVLLGLTGCSRSFREAPNPLAIDAREYDRVFEAAIQVLRDHGFQVDRRDHRFGRITTLPLNSPTVLEPWRPQNTTSQQAWQSTFTNVRRTATVFLEPPAPGDDAYQLRVEVLLENQQWPTRRLVSAQGGRMFSFLSDVPRQWRERGIEPSYWLAVGRDPYLEDRLIRAIIERSLEIGR